MFSIFKKKKNNIFLHIPKTGGSTFVGLLKDSTKLNAKDRLTPTHKIEKIDNVEIYHIDFLNYERKFKKPEIFDAALQSQLIKNSNIFMIIRNPQDRIVSEFNFQYHILDGKNGNPAAAIMQRLPSMPKNLSEYISFSHTQDYQVKFLLGRKLADPNPVTEQEFLSLKNAIVALPIHCGLTENYSDFLSLFEATSGKKLKKEITVRKKTPADLKKNISVQVSNKIKLKNIYDYKLYEFVKDLNKTRKSTDLEGEFNYKTNDDFIV